MKQIIEDQSEKLESVVIGKIKSIESHPNADKLKVCSVDVGKSQPKQIICGAKNVEKDAHVLVAEEGINDLEKYSVKTGEKLFTDLYLD